MSNFSIVKDGLVVNVIISDQSFADALAAVIGGSAYLDGGNRGDLWDGSVFTSPPQADPDPEERQQYIPNHEFIERMTEPELEALYSHTSAKAVLFRERIAITPLINLDAQRFIDSVNAMEAAGVIGVGRAVELLV